MYFDYRQDNYRSGDGWVNPWAEDQLRTTGYQPGAGGGRAPTGPEFMRELMDQALENRQAGEAPSGRKVKQYNGPGQEGPPMKNGGKGQAQVQPGGSQGAPQMQGPQAMQGGGFPSMGGNNPFQMRFAQMLASLLQNREGGYGGPMQGGNPMQALMASRYGMMGTPFPMGVPAGFSNSGGPPGQYGLQPAFVQMMNDLRMRRTMAQMPQGGGSSMSGFGGQNATGSTGSFPTKSRSK